MSLSNFFSIYDKKSQKYRKPFIATTDEEAIRSIKITCMSGQDTVLCDYAEDFELVCLGDYNNDTSGIVSCVNIVSGVSIILVASNSDKKGVIM